MAVVGVPTQSFTRTSTGVSIATWYPISNNPLLPGLLLIPLAASLLVSMFGDPLTLAEQNM